MKCLLLCPFAVGGQTAHQSRVGTRAKLKTKEVENYAKLTKHIRN